MREIKLASDIIKGNLREARKYAEMAMEYKEEHPQLFEWFKKMARTHLDFNTDGHMIAKRMIDDYKASGKHSELAPGMIAMYNIIHADMIKDEAEIKAMLEMLK